jgi:colicin import membrane protein
MRLATDTPLVTRANAPVVAGALALGMHALFVLLLVFGVSWQTEHPAPVMVDLWPALPAATKPAAVQPPVPPKPVPTPAPKPATPKPVADEPPPPKTPDIALEKKRAEADRQNKLKALQAAEDKARKEAARAEAEALKQQRDQRVAEQKRRELLRQMEAEELAQSMADETAANAARAAAGQRQAALAQTVGQYRDLISAKVRGNTRLPDTLKGNPEVRFLVKVLPTGEVTEVRPVKSSGNADYDAAVERAIRKSSPLPLPAEREARAAFVPELLFAHRPKE